jgi:hypothetical protein
MIFIAKHAITEIITRQGKLLLNSFKKTICCLAAFIANLFNARKTTALIKNVYTGPNFDGIKYVI